MFKKIVACLFSFLLIISPAFAEVYTGTTAARSVTAITANASGKIGDVHIQIGESIAEGAAVADMRTTKVFASQNGTVARIHAQNSKETSGTVLELSPVSRYTVYCTSDEAYDSISSNLLHCGETLYLYCTYNGTHQGSGRVYSIDGETYMIETLGGEFYIGETVYLYRDAEYSYKQHVGVGTVVASITELYDDEGLVTEIHVSEGEYVERGELLYEIIEGEAADISSPSNGIITSCEVNEGDSVEKDQVIAYIAPYEEIGVSIQVDETQVPGFSIGDTVKLNYAFHEEDHLVSGVIRDIFHLADGETYTVWIQPDIPPEYLGMITSVQTS